MRTTIRLVDSLMAEAKKIAAEQWATLTAVIETVLRQSFAHQKRAVQRGRVNLTTSGKGGLCPGVDLDHSASLLDIMD